MVFALIGIPNGVPFVIPCPDVIAAFMRILLNIF